MSTYFRNRSFSRHWPVSLAIWLSACWLGWAQSIEVCTNTIRGTLTFNNSNPAVLALLNAPGNEGVSNTLIYAYSVPSGRSSYSPWMPTVTRTGADYAVTVSVDCNDSNGVPYQLTPLASISKGQQYYYFDSKTSAPVVADISGPTLNFQECLGVVRLNFVDELGHPVSITNGTVRAHRASDGLTKVVVHSMPVGATQHRIYVEGGAANWFYMYLYLGSDAYTDRRVHYVATNITAACDEILNVNIVIPSVANFGQIVGTVDMLGEFEWSQDYFNPLLSPGYTTIIAQYGPFQNDRWDQLPGDNMILPSSGAFNLGNIVPSTLDPASRGYYVHAQMLFRTNRAAQYFRTPGLGWGSNAPVVVQPGQTVNLSNIFEINPGYVRGKILLQGPPEIPGHPSLFRGIVHSGDNDLNGDGIPDGAGTYGVYWNYLGYEGVDRRAPGANYTAAYGYGYGDFDGLLDPTDNSYRGNYELALGGLQGEASIWRPWYLNLLFSGGSVWTNDYDYFYNTYTIYDRRDRQTEVVPGQAATNDFAFCFSEVRVTFSSPDTTFYSPQIGSYYPSFTGVDFQGQPADYQIQSVIAYGTPAYLHQATNRGQVTLYLPQGTYTLLPSVVPGDGSGGSIGLEPIQITVGCAARIELEPCLQMNLAIPACYRSNQLSLAGSVLTRCSNNVTQITYELNGAPPQTLCNNCGANPDFNFVLSLAEGDNSLLVTAYDDRGAVTSVSGTLRSDSTPPTIQCPVDGLFAVATRPCGANPTFSVNVTDNCDPRPSISCMPPSGSFFPLGTTPVNCLAIDVAGNVSQCSFPMFVASGPEFPTPTITSVSPQVVGVIGGAQMTIRGTGFTVDDEVLLDGVLLNFRVLVNTNEIQGQAPALPSGAHALQIRRCGQIVATLSNACVSGTLPRIFTFEPRQAFARGSNFVTVRGTNFLPTTRIRVGFPAAGDENLLINQTVSADGSTIIGQVPPLPLTEMLGPRDVIADDPRGNDVLPAGISYLPNPTELDPQVISLRALQSASLEPLDVVFRNGFPIAVNLRVAISEFDPAVRAQMFLRGYADLFRLRSTMLSLDPLIVGTNHLTHVPFEQKHGGVTVFGSRLVVSMLGNEVRAVTGALLPSDALEAQNLNLTPTLSAQQAENIVQAQLNVPLRLHRPSQLEIFSHSIYTRAPMDARLVWRVLMEKAPHEIFVDAHTGETVFRLPLTHESGPSLHGFDLFMLDAEEEANSIVDVCFSLSNDTDMGDENGLFGGYNNNTEAVIAWLGIRDAYTFFHNNFNWHSYDNKSKQIEFVLFSNHPNAMWNPVCQTLEVRKGFTDSEIITHELTHGVIFHSGSALLYAFEPGALNEHYADVMGVSFDRLMNGATDWTFGENRLSMAGAMRDISNPPAFSHPDIRANYQNRDITDDFGGVHANSGIPNKAAFLMIQGGNHNGRPTTGMGLPKTMRLKFEALLRLPMNAGFDAARAMEVAIAAGWAQSGFNGFTSADLCTVRNAWAAVEVGRGDYNCDGIEDDFFDSDDDFVSDQFDNCPTDPNPDQAATDPDRDGLGGKCDNCPNHHNPDQRDNDKDGRGDECDPDDDNDGCLDTVDQHPFSDIHRIGSYLKINCSQENGDIFAFEGGNSDQFALFPDTLRDCEDPDDDNDGIPDELDSCPVGRLPDAFQGECTVRDECPGIPEDYWKVCLFGDCVQYYARFIYAVNPDPTQAVIVDQIRIVNETIYLQPNEGTTVNRLANVIQQYGQLADLAKGSGPNPVRVELWARATQSQPARLVGVLGEYNPETLVLEQLEFGNLLAMSFETNGAPPALGATWHVGADPSAANEDSDHDGLLDGWEHLHNLNSRNPDDALLDNDGDGVSNLDEFRAGTNPNNALSLFRILSLQRTQQGVRLEFQGTAGSRFQIERGLSVDGEWLPVGAEIETRGGIESMVDPGAGAEAQAFYRVRLLEQ